MTTRDVHSRMLSMEFSDNLVHPPIDDHLLFGIDIIDELVAKHLQLEVGSAKIPNFVEVIDVIWCLGSDTDESDYDKLWEVQNLFDFEDDDIDDLAHLNLNSELVDLIDQVCKLDEEPKCSKRAEVQVAETKKSLSVKVATMFTIENDSTTKG
ncbi:hypothetical protein CR513_44352, partial [Mucuna pruriens]